MMKKQGVSNTEFTLSFKCTPNQAALLNCFWSIISRCAPDDSIPMIQDFGWMLDEIMQVIPDILLYSELSGWERIPGFIKAVAEFYQAELGKRYGDSEET